MDRLWALACIRSGKFLAYVGACVAFTFIWMSFDRRKVGTGVGARTVNKKR